jgi:hypothetical protein
VSAPAHGPLALARCDLTLREAIERARASEVRLVGWRRMGARLDDPMLIAAQEEYTRHLRRVTELVSRFTAVGERCPFCTEARAP